MSALRILHVDTGRGWRGGQAQVELLIRGLAARGHVQALAAPDGPLAARVRALGGVEWLRFAPRSDADAPAALGLARRALAFRPDVVHLHDARAHATGWPAARLARAACLVSRRVAFAGSGRAPHAFKYRRLPVDRFLVISRPVGDELRALGVEGERIVLVPDGVDVAGTAAAVDAARADGRRERGRAAWGAAAGDFVLGVIAAFTQEKGQDRLLEAFARAAAGPGGGGLRLVLVGEGPAEGALRDAAARLGLADRVIFAGPAADLPAALAAFDALAVPSLAEGFGSIVLLAQAAGVPVLASRVGGLVDVIAAGETGLLLAPDDPAAWAEAIAESVARPDAGRARAERARHAVEQFDVARLVECTEAAARQALAARGLG